MEPNSSITVGVNALSELELRRNNVRRIEAFILDCKSSILKKEIMLDEYDKLFRNNCGGLDDIYDTERSIEILGNKLAFGERRLSFYNNSDENE